MIHVVQKGQTLGKIAKRYHVSIDDLRKENNIGKGKKIRPGQELVIPGIIAKEEKPSKNEKVSKNSKKKPKKEKVTYEQKPKRPGYIRVVLGSEKYEGQLRNGKGKLNSKAMDGVSKMLRFLPTNSRTKIDTRLIALLGIVSDHFGGKKLFITSGYRPRTPNQYTPHSKHNIGRAVDFSIEGVPNTVLRDFCRTLRNSGVGYYPNSTFVHLDVREMKTYWVDYSGPGERPQYTQTSEVAKNENQKKIEQPSPSKPTDDSITNSASPSKTEHEDMDVLQKQTKDNSIQNLSPPENVANPNSNVEQSPPVVAPKTEKNP